MLNSSNESWLKSKRPLVLLGVLVVGAIVVVSILRDYITNPYQNQVAVIGQGKVYYQPDIANITLGVQVDKVKKAEDALNQLNGSINKIIEAVKKAGVKAEDIQTQNYSLNPQYDTVNGISTVTGYSVNQQLVIKVKNFKSGSDQVSKVISEASKAGANQVAGVNFDSSRLEELKQEARIIAISDARAKAGSIAEAAGVRLGKVIGWWENIIQAPNTSQYASQDYGKGGMGGGEVSAPSVPSGTQEIIIEINFTVKRISLQ